MYRVDWLQSGLDELTAIWVQADSDLRKQITNAANQVELILQKDPLNEGESRSGKRRITFFPPLAFNSE